MNRSDFQTLAEARVKDAETLLAGGRWAAAYYLLGYAVECALKAVVAKRFREHEVPEKRVVIDFYTHQRVDRLLSISGAKPAWEATARSDPRFVDNWKTVRDWTEASRYDYSTTESKAKAMFMAVADPSSGVLSWLKTQW